MAVGLAQRCLPSRKGRGCKQDNGVRIRDAQSKVEAYVPAAKDAAKDRGCLGVVVALGRQCSLVTPSLEVATRFRYRKARQVAQDYGTPLYSSARGLQRLAFRSRQSVVVHVTYQDRTPATTARGGVPGFEPEAAVELREGHDLRDRGGWPKRSWIIRGRPPFYFRGAGVFQRCHPLFGAAAT